MLKLSTGLIRLSVVDGDPGSGFGDLLGAVGHVALLWISCPVRCRNHPAAVGSLKRWSHRLFQWKGMNRSLLFVV